MARRQYPDHRGSPLPAHPRVADEGGFDLSDHPVIRDWIECMKALPRFLRIPLKMTADSEERDRLAHRFLTGAGFLLRAVMIGQLGGQFAHRFPAQFEAVRTVQQSVEDGVRQGRLADVVVPVLGG